MNELRPLITVIALLGMFAAVAVLLGLVGQIIVAMLDWWEDRKR